MISGPLGGLIVVVVALALVGVLLWAIEQFPMDATIKTLIRVVIVVAVVFWLASFLLGYGPALGAWPGVRR